MYLSRTQKLGVAGVSVLFLAALGLGAVVAMTTAGGPRSKASATTADHASTTTTLPAPTPTTGVTGDGAGDGPASAPAPAPDPAPGDGNKPPAAIQPVIKIDPAILGKLDNTGPAIKITSVSCGYGKVKVYFSASDPSGITNFNMMLYSGANGVVNLPEQGTVTALSPNNYSVVFLPLPMTNNHVVLTVVDGFGNSNSTSANNLCI